MKFIKLQTLVDGGVPGPSYWAVPEKICGVVSIMVPGEISGPGGKKIHSEKAGLDIGDKVIPINLTPEELVEKLEGVE